jgi:hypothetical protein
MSLNRYSDDWLMQHFENTTINSPTTTSNRLHPQRRLFPEDGHDDSEFNQQEQQERQVQQQQQQQQHHSERRVRRQLFRDDIEEDDERQIVSPPRPVRIQQHRSHGGQQIGIVTPPTGPTKSRMEDS